VFALARETGWSRDFILWELALSEVLQYNHCALRAMNCWTVKPMPDGKAQIERLEAVLARDFDEEGDV
jgi:hypothetical protein